MANWVEKYKNRVYSSRHQHLLLRDGDKLLAYPELSSSLEEDGYRILHARSTLDVRILYELHVRDHPAKLILVAPGDYQPLPDIAGQVHVAAIGLRDLFPNLEATALQGISFNALCTLGNIKPYEILGYDRTLRFLLENLYPLDVNTLTLRRAKERVLDALITVLLDRDDVHPPLLDFLSTLAKPYFPELAKPGLSRERLRQFLQTAWAAYVAGAETGIDFTAPGLGKSIGYLFIRGDLQAVQVSRAVYETIPKSLHIGLWYDSDEAQRIELTALLDYLAGETALIQDLPDEWFKLMPVLARAMNSLMALKPDGISEQFHAVERRLNDRFQQFLENAYESLFSRSGVRHPVLVSRVLEHIRAQPERKKALIVLDGLNFWQWELIAAVLKQTGLHPQTGATLAYIPTITAWSRQALLRGGKPDMETDNAREKQLFFEYWTAQHLQEYQVQYGRFGVNLGFDPEALPPDTEILALVCNDLDDLMHGVVLGNDQLRLSTLQWLEKSRLAELLHALKNKGYLCYLTTDHGNIEARGIKNLKIAEKVGAISRSKRHLQFSNSILLAQFRGQNPSLRLGTRDLSIFLKDTDAFTDVQTTIVTHGGSNMWEVLIPFVRI